VVNKKGMKLLFEVALQLLQAGCQLTFSPVFIIVSLIS
jgi:hypothetical protein